MECGGKLDSDVKRKRDITKNDEADTIQVHRQGGATRTPCLIQTMGHYMENRILEPPNLQRWV